MTNEVSETVRPFNLQADLDMVLQAVGDWNVLADECGYLHFGDICHYLSNSLRGNDPSESMFLCVGADDQLLAVIMLWPPRHFAFNLLMIPAGRGSALESELINWSYQKLQDRNQAGDDEKTTTMTDVMDCDIIRQDLLEALGYEAAPKPYLAYTTRSLLDPVPEPVLPEGFTIRDDLTVADLEQLSEVHSGAFDSDWSNDAYKAVMESPGYHFGHELVVVAPDGRFAAFLIYWPDATTQTALFEPVGCHRDFQRMGLTRALMYDAMKRMIALNMHGARVNHEIDNPASAGLYAAVGFTRKYTVSEYGKTQNKD